MKCLVMGRHDPSRRERCDLWGHAWSTICDNSPLSPTDHTVPYGTGFWRARSRHSMPGYHHLVPPGQTHLRPYVDAHAPTRGAIPNWRTTPTLQHSITPTLHHSITPSLRAAGFEDEDDDEDEDEAPLAIGYWLFSQPLVVIFLMPDVRRSGDVLLDHVPDGAGND
jgi:hypothetical protein